MVTREIRVWDLPTRLFHWLLVASVVGAVATVKVGGGWMAWHERFGLAVLALIVFRIVWGCVGSTHARFTSFIPSPRALFDYLRGRWRGHGHNPLGAFSVLAMIALFGAQATSGLFAWDDIAHGGPLRRAVSGATSAALTGWHMRAEYLLYGLVALHLSAVLFYTLVMRERLVAPMVTGRKEVADAMARDAEGGGLLAFLFALAITVGVVWIAQGGLLAPPPPPPPDLGW